MPQSKMIDLALSYISAQWPVFPTRAKEEMDPHTGEFLAPKTPLTSNGLKAATKTERIVREWWKRYPDAMVAVPTGSPIGAFVLDVDNKPGGANGFAWLDDMIAEHGPLPYTKRVKTPNGGLHIFFTYVPGTRNRGALGAGVDIRSEGGYVVAAGSVMGDGRAYEWEDPDAPIADAPDWLLVLVVKRDQPAPVVDYRPGQNEPYVNAAVDAELRELAATPQGARNNALNDAAFSLGTLVGAGALPRHEAESALLSIASQWPNIKLSTGTIRRGLDAGIRQPRQIPERQYEQDNTRLIDIRRMLENASRKKDHIEKSALNAESEECIPTSDKPAKEPATQKAEKPKNDAAPKPSSDAEPATQPTEPQPFTATPFTWIDPKTLPRRVFAYGTHYIRKYVSVTVSPGGLGKTSNSIVEALAMASGKPLLGIKPAARHKVWLFNAEDPRDEMERRIMAACLHYRLKPADLDGHLFLDTGREQELVIAKDDRKRGVVIVEPVVEAVVGQIQANAIDVMIVDPFVSTHQVNENDNGAIDKVAKLWAQIADHTNCAIDVVHHLRKVSDREATVEDARGAVALIGAARSVRVLNRMSEEQADKAGVPKDERFSYFNVHAGKVNLTKYDASQTWRKLESVALGNGRGLTKPQDHAGVVTEWKWPSKDEVAAAVPDAARHKAIVTLGNQNCRESDQSPDWAGYVVADALGIELEVNRKMTAEKRRVKSILESWIDAGLLVVEQEDDPAHVGRKLSFVRPAQ